MASEFVRKIRHAQPPFEDHGQLSDLDLISDGTNVYIKVGKEFKQITNEKGAQENG